MPVIDLATLIGGKVLQKYNSIGDLSEMVAARAGKRAARRTVFRALNYSRATIPAITAATSAGSGRYNYSFRKHPS